MKFNPYLTLYTNINLRQLLDLNVKATNYKASKTKQKIIFLS